MSIASEYLPTEEEIEQAKPLRWIADISDGADMMTQNLPPVVEIVEGLIVEQTKCVIASGSKSFKTWLSILIALAIAHGKKVLNRATLRQRVLYVNLELRPTTFTRRVQMIATATGTAIERDWFKHLSLRGKMSGLSVRELVNHIIAHAKHLKIGVIVLDPVYKANVEGEENNSRDQTLFFNELDRITTEAGCTLILNDHFGKGSQHEKDPLDAIRGSSAKGGDLDAALILRKHEIDECFRVDVIHRELPPVQPFCIGWECPLMVLRPDLDPEAMKKPKGGRPKAYSDATLLEAIAQTTPQKAISISHWAKALDIERTTLSGYLPGLRKRGLIATVGDGTGARQHITKKGTNLLNSEASCA